MLYPLSGVLCWILVLTLGMRSDAQYSTDPWRQYSSMGDTLRLLVWCMPPLHPRSIAASWPGCQSVYTTIGPPIVSSMSSIRSTPPPLPLYQPALTAVKKSRSLRARRSTWLQIYVSGSASVSRLLFLNSILEKSCTRQLCYFVSVFRTLHPVFSSEPL